MPVDPFALHAEFGNFVGHVHLKNKKFDSLADAASFSEEWKTAFRLPSKLSGFS